ncbi:UNVERIFIED_CONTAM: hypothetical protein HDU68_000732 [Siphonaria sp. JEL0065]|nr:hypothetical protein HDU68_000732 [Siphonaria sp. JEL0065]
MERLLGLLTFAQTQLETNEPRIGNAGRLKSLIKGERAFLLKAQSSKTKEKQRIAAASSNAPFFVNICDCAVRLCERASVFVVKKVCARLCVDVVVAYKPVWIKIRAASVRSARWEGDHADADDDADEVDDDDDQEDGQEEEEEHPLDNLQPQQPQPQIDVTNLRIMKQARAWVNAAKLNPVHFVTPKVVFCFTFLDSSLDDLDRILIDALTELGVHVVFGIDSLIDWVSKNALIPVVESGVSIASTDTSSSSSSAAAAATAASLLTPVLNLDLTTLISLVSDTCHRFERIPKHVFDVDALVQQEALEAKSPLLQELYPIFQTRTLVTTRTAFLKFIPIATKIAGPFEKHRIRLLFDRSRMDPDLVSMLDEATALSPPQDCNVQESQVLEWTSAGVLVGKVGVIKDDPSPRFQRLLEISSSTRTTPPSGIDKKKNKQRESKENGGGDDAPSVTQQPQQPRLKISETNVIIYGTADRHSWTTCTGNMSLVRSFEQNLSGEEGDGKRGVSLYLHAPRSLIEARKGGF